MSTQPHEARALWIAAAQKAVIRAETLPIPAAHEVLLRTAFTAVSRGTERLVFEGRVPASEAARMRAPMQEGEFSFPIKYGYSSVGEIVQGPKHLLGRYAFALAPHQDWLVADAQRITLLPEGLEPARAVLAANMETALNGVWDAELKAGDRVLVIGAGVVGCLVAFLCARHPGTKVSLVDVDESKAAIAERLGLAFLTPSAVHDLDADVVFHASGHPQGLETALGAAGQEARIVELSWYGDALVPLSLGGAFHVKRLTLRSSQVGQLPLSQRARWTYARRVETALSLLRAPELDALINSECSFDALPERLGQILGTTSNVLCHRVRY